MTGAKTVSLHHFERCFSPETAIASVDVRRCAVFRYGGDDGTALDETAGCKV